jgi:2-amino-4-hydroxy-6-hydroxymethyldihydropteridine diphosphokinase
MTLALGSNIGDREENLSRAIEFIDDRIGRVISKSSTYRTGSWGYEGGEYLNMVLICETELLPKEILSMVKSYEKARGREKRKQGYEDRIIDIDILYFGDALVDEPGLHIPHRAITRRRFVLAPLAEILPDAIHPELGLSSLEMLEQCEDDTLCEVLR